MKERPILFSGPMIRAILDGQKTQTRRVVKGAGWDPSEYQKVHLLQCDEQAYGLQAFFERDGQEWKPGVRCPYGQPGDRLWVKETWAANAFMNLRSVSGLKGEKIYYRATYENHSHFVWRPSIHMPRWASRITLEITGVRVERLKDISEEDAKAEGIEPSRNGFWKNSMNEGKPFVLPVSSYASLWESINGSWEPEKWVWVIQFKRP